MLETKKGPLGLPVTIFDLEDLEILTLNRDRNLQGFLFIDLNGSLHFELNNMRLILGNPLEMIFLPNRFYRKLGATYASYSLHKRPETLLGAMRFFFYAKDREIRPAGTALLPRDLVPEAATTVRKEAFGELWNGLDRLARALGADRGIVSADRVPADRMIANGWEPWKPTTWRETIRYRFFWFPAWPKTFYTKRWGF